MRGGGFRYSCAGTPGLEKAIAGAVISIDLDRLFRSAVKIGSFLRPVIIQGDDIEFICLYGDALYKDFSPEEYHRLGKPNVVEIMLITKEKCDQKKILKSEKPIRRATKYNYFSPHFKVDLDSFGGGLEGLSDCGYILKKKRKGLKIGVVYKSVHELINQFKNGDELSKSVIMYGLPIIGQRNFERILQGLEVQREINCHKIIFYTNGFSGRISGRMD